MTVSRRQVLKSALALPFCSWETQPAACILAENHCLAAESAAGFRNAVHPNRHIVVVAASRNLTTRRARLIKHRAAAGALVLFEIAPDQSAQQARRLAAHFQLRVGSPHATDAWHGDYVEYLQPIGRLVRPFLSPLPLSSQNGQILARINEIPTVVITPLGRGNIVFLGSLLGPALYAGDREAHHVITALVQRTNYASV